jgi:hypothetical protein
MKAKQLVILLLVLAVAGGIGLYLARQKQSAWQGASSSGIAGQKVMGEFDPNAAATLSIQAADGAKVTLSKAGEQWVVKERGDYPADFDKIGSFVRQLWDLKAVQEVKATDAQLPRLGLAKTKEEATGSASTVIELLGKEENRIAGVILGKLHYRDGGEEEGGGFATGRYVMALGDAGKSPALVSETFSNAEAKPEQWLSKEFLQITGIKTVTLEGAEEGMQWLLKRAEAGGAWELEGRLEPEKLDSAKIPSIDGLLGSPRFVDVLTPGNGPDGMEQPTKIAVTAADGFRYAFEVGKPQNDRYPVRVTAGAELAEKREAKPDEKPEEKEKLDKEFEARRTELVAKLEKEKKFEGRLFLMEQFSIKPLLVKRTDLLAPPATPTPTPTPAPGASPSPAPSPSASPRISVTTEPVSLPAPEAKKKPSKKAK